MLSDTGGEVPSCLSCGACCFSDLERYVGVSGDDYARLGDRAQELARFDGHSAFMVMRDGHCAALELDLQTSEFRCATYETRPQICRDLGRGSPACAAERELKGERPLSQLRARRADAPPRG